jgi:threonine dehydratase
MSVMRYGLTSAGRFLVVRTRIPDRPGELIKLLQLCAEKRVNVISVEHHREGMQISVAESEVELRVGTRDVAHGNEVIAALQEHGYPTERVR